LGFERAAFEEGFAFAVGHGHIDDSYCWCR
jgi:hypothetical protein